MIQLGTQLKPIASLQKCIDKREALQHVCRWRDGAGARLHGPSQPLCQPRAHVGRSGLDSGSNGPQDAGCSLQEMPPDGKQQRVQDVHHLWTPPSVDGSETHAARRLAQAATLPYRVCADAVALKRAQAGSQHRLTGDYPFQHCVAWRHQPRPSSPVAPHTQQPGFNSHSLMAPHRTVRTWLATAMAFDHAKVSVQSSCSSRHTTDCKWCVFNHDCWPRSRSRATPGQHSRTQLCTPPTRTCLVVSRASCLNTSPIAAPSASSARELDSISASEASGRSWPSCEQPRDKNTQRLVGDVATSDQLTA